MSRRKKKEPESVLQGAKIPSPIQQMQPPEKKTSPIITVPLALVGIAALIFGLVKWIKFAWYF